MINDRKIPEYYPTMFLDGFTPQEIFFAKQKLVHREFLEKQEKEKQKKEELKRQKEFDKQLEKEINEKLEKCLDKALNDLLKDFK